MNEWTNKRMNETNEQTELNWTELNWCEWNWIEIEMKMTLDPSNLTKISKRPIFGSIVFWYFPKLSERIQTRPNASVQMGPNGSKHIRKLQKTYKNIRSSFYERNLKIIYKFICKFWEGNKDYEEWHEGQVVLVLKREIQATPINEEV